MSGGARAAFTSWTIDHVEFAGPEWGWRWTARGLVPNKQKGTLVGSVGVFVVRITPRLTGSGYDPLTRRVLVTHSMTDETICAADAADFEDLCAIIEHAVEMFLEKCA